MRPILIMSSSLRFGHQTFPEMDRFGARRMARCMIQVRAIAEQSVVLILQGTENLADVGSIPPPIHQRERLSQSIKVKMEPMVLRGGENERQNRNQEYRN